MASRKLTPGSYVVLAGLLLLSLIVAVISFIIPFTLYPSAEHGEKEAHGEEVEAIAADIDLMYTPEAPASSDAAREFQERILASYGGDDISVDSSSEAEAEEANTDESGSESESNGSSTVSADAALNIMNSAGCLACHQAGSEGVAAIGPSLNGIAERVDSYDVDLDPEAYVRQSIVNPAAFLSPECPPSGDPCQNVMPATYEDSLSESEIDTIVSYLVTLPAE